MLFFAVKSVCRSPAHVPVLFMINFINIYTFSDSRAGFVQEGKAFFHHSFVYICISAFEVMSVYPMDQYQNQNPMRNETLLVEKEGFMHMVQYS